MTTNSDEALDGPLKGAGSTEEVEVAQYQPPSPHRLQFKRRVFEVEGWVAKQGLVKREEVTAYVMARWGLDAKQANEYTAAVVKDFERIGRVYGR